MPRPHFKRFVKRQLINIGLKTPKGRYYDADYAATTENDAEEVYKRYVKRCEHEQCGCMTYNRFTAALMGLGYRGISKENLQKRIDHDKYISRRMKNMIIPQYNKK